MLRWRVMRVSLVAALCGVFTAGWTGGAATAEPARLTFHAAFAGVAPDGEHCTWNGDVAGATRGRVTIALRQVEPPTAAANPVWHVTTSWTVRDAREARSFAGELEGMVDWRAGTLRLGGTVTDGWRKGSWAAVDARISRGDLAGSVTILPAVARR